MPKWMLFCVFIALLFGAVALREQHHWADIYLAAIAGMIWGMETK